MKKVETVNLEQEFNQKIKNDIATFNFICNEVLDGIWYWNLENPKHEWMSKNYWTTLGFDPTEMPLTSDSWQEIIHQDDLALSREMLQLHIENPKIPFDQTVRMFKKDGEIIWMRVKAQALANKEGKLTRIIGTHLLTSTLVFRAGEIKQHINLSQKAISVSFQNDDLPNSSSTIFKLLKEQEAKEKSNKSEFEDNFTSTKNKHSDKLTVFFNRFELNTQQIGSFVQNLVNQVELQNKINSRDHLLNYFNKNTSDGLLIFNEKLQAIYINDAVENLVGKKFKDFPISLSKTMDYFHPEDLQNLILKITNAIEQKQEKLKTQHPVFSANQKIIWIESCITFTYDSNGKFQIAIVISRDITKSIELTKELKKSSERRMKIAEQLIEEREKNKEELYTELHDGINQLLFAARLNIENSGLTNKNLESSVSKLKIAIEHIRKIALESTTQFVFGASFVSSITDYILGFNSTAIKFRVETDINEPIFINDKSKKYIHRIVQDLMRFSIETSKITKTVFRFKQIDSNFVIMCSYNGKYNQESTIGNLNLKSIQDRIYLFEGKIRFFNINQMGLIVYIKIQTNE